MATEERIDRIEHVTSALAAKTAKNTASFGATPNGKSTTSPSKSRTPTTPSLN
jgi:hypothetical protein